MPCADSSTSIVYLVSITGVGGSTIMPNWFAAPNAVPHKVEEPTLAETWWLWNGRLWVAEPQNTMGSRGTHTAHNWVVPIPQKGRGLARCWWSVDDQGFDRNNIDRFLLCRIPWVAPRNNRRYAVSRLRPQSGYARLVIQLNWYPYYLWLGNIFTIFVTTNVLYKIFITQVYMVQKMDKCTDHVYDYHLFCDIHLIP